MPTLHCTESYLSCIACVLLVLGRSELRTAISVAPQRRLSPKTMDSSLSESLCGCGLNYTATFRKTKHAVQLRIWISICKCKCSKAFNLNINCKCYHSTWADRSRLGSKPDQFKNQTSFFVFTLYFPNFIMMYINCVCVSQWSRKHYYFNHHDRMQTVFVVVTKCLH